jgi:xanthine dehydrogenase accessory factor
MSVKDMRDVLRAAIDSCRRGIDCVYCVVVETRGSTPQKPGAAMTVFQGGRQVGTLGGGCVEAEVRQQALRLVGQSEPQILTFLLDNDYGWDDGLICGGRMTFLAQPLSAPNPAPYFATLAELVDSGSGCIEAAVIDAQQTGPSAGSRFLFDRNRCLRALYRADSCPPEITASLPDLADRPRPSTRSGVAYLPVLPRCRLLIVGAGHVARAVAELADQVDFDVWVMDDREKYASAERFPMAKRILVGNYASRLKDFQADENTYALVITRGHAHDQEAVFHLAEKPFRYLGMIGSRRKIRLIFDDLVREGVPQAALDRVYAPLGIDIGSQTVPEIAVSIVAQLVGHRNRGPAAFPPPRVCRDNC